MSRARAEAAADDADAAGVAASGARDEGREPARTGLPMTVAPGSAVSGERHRGRGAEPDAESLFARPGSRVLFVDDHRDPQEPGGEDARKRRVAAEPDDDARPEPADDPDCARERDRIAPAMRTSSTRCCGDIRRWKPRAGEQVDLEAGVGHDARLEAAACRRGSGPTPGRGRARRARAASASAGYM